MGYSLSWVAIKGKSRQAVLEETGFQATGEREPIPESDFSAMELPSGWYLIVSNCRKPIISDEALAQLSVGGDVITCFVEEHVMCSSATAWKNRSECWTATHNAQKGRNDLETQGQLPPMFDSISNELKSKQQNADTKEQNVDFIFDIPVQLAFAITGYRHDRNILELSNKLFEVLLSKQEDKTTFDSSFSRLSHKWTQLAS